jgi:hypothetical protein
MEINFSKNTLHIANVPIKQTKDVYDIWYESISNFIYECIKNEEISFLSHYPPDKSIGDDFCSNNLKIKTYDNTFYYYFSNCLTIDNIKLLIKDEEFYLGNIILIKGSCNKDSAYLLALYWEKELIISGKEIFRMGDDGYSFYCYNIADENFNTNFKNFIQKLEIS